MVVMKCAHWSYPQNLYRLYSIFKLHIMVIWKFKVNILIRLSRTYKFISYAINMNDRSLILKNKQLKKYMSASYSRPLTATMLTFENRKLSKAKLPCTCNSYFADTQKSSYQIKLRKRQISRNIFENLVTLSLQLILDYPCIRWSVYEQRWALNP